MEQKIMQIEQQTTIPRTCTHEDLESTINCLRANQMAVALFDAGFITADELTALKAANQRSFAAYLSDLY